MRYERLRLCNVSVSNGMHQILQNLNVSVMKSQNMAFVVANDLEATAFLDLLTGRCAQDAGLFLVEDQPIKLRTQRDAVQNGIYSLRRDSQLIYKMSIEENIFFTRDEFYSHGFQNRRLIHTMCLDLFEKFGITKLSPTMPVLHLDPFARFYVELLKLYIQKPRILVIEAPNFDYHPVQCGLLSAFFEKCAQQETACICVANKFLPIMKSCEKVCLLHHGAINYIFDTNEQTPEHIRRALFDPQYQLPHEFTESTEQPPGNWSFSVRNLGFLSSGLQLELDVHPSEVVGIWDVQRRNTDELKRYLNGKEKKAGKFFLNEDTIQLQSRQSAIQKGICIIDDTMITNPVFYNMSLRDNVSLLLSGEAYQIPPLISPSVQQYTMQWALEKIGAEDLISHCGKGKTIPDLTRPLQMKIVVARFLCTAPKVIVFVNPFSIYNETTIRDFKKILHALRRLGIGVVLWSFTQEYLLDASDTLITLIGDRPVKQKLRPVLRYQPFADMTR